MTSEKRLLMGRRLPIFIAVSFVLTWIAWGTAGSLARAGLTSYGQWPFMALYVLGGLGPTIAAYIAVLMTRAQAPLREFHRRLFRWRVAWWWYVVAIGLPIMVAIAAVWITGWFRPDLAAAVSVRAWYLFVPTFATMIVGGGLEELGWRGVAQPELQRAMGPARAALLDGLICAAWHIPLFILPGVSQYMGHFLPFATLVIGMALVLGWIYSHTESILLCVFLHASSNAIVTLGVFIPSASGWPAFLSPGLYVLAGGVLLSVAAARQSRCAAVGVEGC